MLLQNLLQALLNKAVVCTQNNLLDDAVCCLDTFKEVAAAAGTEVSVEDGIVTVEDGEAIATNEHVDIVTLELDTMIYEEVLEAAAEM